MSYIIKRVLSIIPILTVVSITVFTIIYFTSGSPASQIIGLEATQVQIDAMDEALGLNDPFFIQYFRWIKKLLD